MTPLIQTKLWLDQDPINTFFCQFSRFTIKIVIFFSMKQWEERKGWKYLVRAFIDEFKDSEDIILLIVSRGFKRRDPYEQVRRFLNVSEYVQ